MGINGFLPSEPSEIDVDCFVVTGPACFCGIIGEAGYIPFVWRTGDPGFEAFSRVVWEYGVFGFIGQFGLAEWAGPVVHSGSILSSKFEQVWSLVVSLFWSAQKANPFQGSPLQ